VNVTGAKPSNELTDLAQDHVASASARACDRLSELPGVAEIAVVARNFAGEGGAGGEVSLVAYVVPELDETVIDLELKATWQLIYGELASGSEHDPSFDTSGWNSSLTGAPYSAEEMQEYVETTIGLMQEAAPRTVLDIGCGTGMPLLRVAPQCERYIGVDQSECTIEKLNAVVQRAGLGQVTLEVAEATDVGKFGARAFDLVACNSASQHFPGLDYLLQVINAARTLVKPTGRIVISDVRDFSLEREFHSTVVCSQADSAAPRDVLLHRVGQRRLQERELMVDPRWFSFALDDSETVIEVRPRRGYCRNETTVFHYDVVIHDAHYVDLVHLDTWYDWRNDAMSLDRLVELMNTTREEFYVRSVPNARTIEANMSAARVFEDTKLAGRIDNGADEDEHGVEPDDVLALAGQCGYDCYLSRINARTGGAFDMAVLRSGRGAGGRKRIPSFKDDQRTSMPDSLSTDPRRYHLLTAARASLTPSLRRYAATYLTPQERPAFYVMVHELPKRDGRLDVSALPIPRVARSRG